MSHQQPEPICLAHCLLRPSSQASLFASQLPWPGEIQPGPPTGLAAGGSLTLRTVTSVGHRLCRGCVTSVGHRLCRGCVSHLSGSARWLWRQMSLQIQQPQTCRGVFSKWWNSFWLVFKRKPKGTHTFSGSPTLETRRS